jgi:restriction endonuclease Mrr
MVARSTINFRDHRVYLVHLLKVLARHGGAAAPGEIYDEVADLAGVTEEERAIASARGTDNPVYRNRIQFARQALVDARMVVGSSDPGWLRGMWALTEAGRTLAGTGLNDEALDKELKKRAADGLRERAKRREEGKRLAGIDGATDEDADEIGGGARGEREEAPSGPTIRELVDVANEEVMQTMLDLVRSMNDTAFEHLVGTVLKAALRAEGVKVTQQSRDGGIDGVLQFDALGMRIAVFEAKRYGEATVVGRPQIDAFATAARRRRAAHALFVTSGRFSREAATAARDEGIRLVDGDALVELMARHGVGMQAKETFVVYELDPAWSFDLEELRG